MSDLNIRLQDLEREYEAAISAEISSKDEVLIVERTAKGKSGELWKQKGLLLDVRIKKLELEKVLRRNIISRDEKQGELEELKEERDKRSARGEGIQSFKVSSKEQVVFYQNNLVQIQCFADSCEKLVTSANHENARRGETLTQLGGTNEHSLNRIKTIQSEKVQISAMIVAEEKEAEKLDERIGVLSNGVKKAIERRKEMRRKVHVIEEEVDQAKAKNSSNSMSMFSFSGGNNVTPSP